MASLQERVSRLRSRLDGEQRRTNKRVENKASPAEGLLFGVTLHAAARLGKGAKLSPLENRMLDLFRAFADDEEEVKEYGTTFLKAKQNTTSSTLGGIFPKSILALDDSQAYTEKDLRRDLIALLPELQALPQNKVVDLNKVAPDDIDTDEYAQAIAAAGGGVTVYIAPDPSEGDAQEATPADPNTEWLPTGEVEYLPFITPQDTSPKRALIVMDRFYCHQSSGDTITGPRDEIYWCVATGSDGRSKADYKSQTFGSIEAGSERKFNNDAILFNGTVPVDMTGHVEVWEEDDSPSSWHNKLKEALFKIAQECIDRAVEANRMGDAYGDAEGAMGTVAAILGLAAMAAALIAELINLIRNDDDLVCKREFGFVTEGVDFFFNYPDWELPMVFDGGGMGKHTLYLRRKVDSRTQDMGRLMYSKLSGNSWGSPFGGQGRTAHGMAMITYKGVPWSFFARSSDGVFGVSRWWDNHWQTVQWIDNIAMKCRPAVVEFKGAVWMVWVDTENNLRCTSTTTLTSWTKGREYISSTAKSETTPTLTVWNNEALMCVHRAASAGNAKLYVSWSRGSGWTSWADTGLSSPYAPALCLVPSRGKMGLFLVSSDYRIGFHTFDGSYGGNTWSGRTGWDRRSGSGLSVISDGNAHVIVFRERTKQGRVGVYRTNAGATYLGSACIGAPNVCAWEGAVYVGWSDLHE
ncbi:hypothetical protein BP00DRAFT_125753 [Aspergillus indologenus CBS 114.80]|uniref:Fucose-specific lectin n=1 Tax=Aspergillus indologenus CBS 114.80 TaxID=1450541 RepID=A0A2V5IWW1_9EURO|nr:hypothetical protein BP00DRAFT_125753 [Aspergillus indologenus CBS 114.80]